MVKSSNILPLSIHYSLGTILLNLYKMTNEEFNELFRRRTMAYALAVIEFLETVPNNTATRVMNYQFCKAATSVGANFRAFCRGRSKNERFSKICIVTEEADESLYWTELFGKTNYGD